MRSVPLQRFPHTVLRNLPFLTLLSGLQYILQTRESVWTLLLPASSFQIRIETCSSILTDLLHQERKKYFAELLWIALANPRSFSAVSSSSYAMLPQALLQELFFPLTVVSPHTQEFNQKALQKMNFAENNGSSCFSKTAVYIIVEESRANKSCNGKF